jgi:(p)ppGpp synthase/HD superfamily hydrolase
VVAAAFRDQRRRETITMAEQTDNPMLNEKFRRALDLAVELHHAQLRKSSDVPYVGHLLVVAGTVLEHGGDEDETAAALLHDAVEDQGGLPTLERIRKTCGERVAALVEALSDRIPGSDQPRMGWRARKERYVAHLASADDGVRLVACADKLHNCRAMVHDYRSKGEALWSRFGAGRDEQVWFYRACTTALRDAPRSTRVEPLLEELEDSVAELELLAERGGLAHAMAISAWAHANRRDETGMAYALHPIRIMLQQTSEPTRIVALLHDVVDEAPGWSFERLRREGFPEEVVAAVDALTRREGEGESSYLHRVAGNALACAVKTADLKDGMDLSRLPRLQEQDLARARRNHEALDRLAALMRIS